MSFGATVMCLMLCLSVCCLDRADDLAGTFFSYSQIILNKLKIGLDTNDRSTQDVTRTHRPMGG